MEKEGKVLLKENEWKIEQKDNRTGQERMRKVENERDKMLQI